MLAESTQFAIHLFTSSIVNGMKLGYNFYDYI